MSQILAATAVMLALAAPSAAVDTVESWYEGETGVEFYAGLDGFGLPGAEQTVSGAMILGWGLTDRLSTYLAPGVQSDGDLIGAETEINLGLFGTPLDTDHVDLDLLFDLRVVGGEMSVVPAFELNLDREPDLAAYGLFLRGAMELGPHENFEGETERHVDLGLTVGGYYSLTARQQILVKYGATVHERAPGHERFEHDTVAVGYNALLTDYLELITEAAVTLATDERGASVGVVLGLVATFPSTID